MHFWSLWKDRFAIRGCSMIKLNFFVNHIFVFMHYVFLITLVGRVHGPRIFDDWTGLADRSPERFQPLWKQVRRLLDRSFFFFFIFSLEEIFFANCNTNNKRPESGAFPTTGVTTFHWFYIFITPCYLNPKLLTDGVSVLLTRQSIYRTWVW